MFFVITLYLDTILLVCISKSVGFDLYSNSYFFPRNTHAYEYLQLF